MLKDNANKNNSSISLHLSSSINEKENIKINKKDNSDNNNKNNDIKNNINILNLINLTEDTSTKKVETELLIQLKC